MIRARDGRGRLPRAPGTIVAYFASITGLPGIRQHQFWSEGRPLPNPPEGARRAGGRPAVRGRSRSSHNSLLRCGSSGPPPPPPPPPPPQV